MLALRTINYQQMSNNDAINTQNCEEYKKISDKKKGEKTEIPLKVMIHAQKMEKAIIFFKTRNTS